MHGRRLFCRAPAAVARATTGASREPDIRPFRSAPPKSRPNLRLQRRFRLDDAGMRDDRGRPLEPAPPRAYDLRPMAGLRCNVVTPTESVLESEASYIEFPAWDGQKGVAPGAAPFLVRLGQGRLRIEKPAGGADTFLVDGGFAQMNGGTLTILADGVTNSTAINLADAEKELANASSEGLKSGSLDARNAAEHRQRLAYARVALARSARR